MRTRRSIAYQLVYRVVIRLLTFPIFAATMNWAFSTMNIVKIKLRRIMKNKFLMDSLILYIKSEIVANFSTYSILDNFEEMFIFVSSLLLIF